MAGYSGTPLPQKLGIEPGTRLGLALAPAAFKSTLGALPAGAKTSDTARAAGPFGVKTDITEDTVRELGLPLGLVDNKVCAVDEVWSGLRLVWRLSERPKLGRGQEKTRSSRKQS